MNMTLRQLEDLAKQAKSNKDKVKKYKEEAQKAVNGILNVVEVNGTAFGMGVINGRFQNPQLLGVPVDLGAGVAMQIMSLFDLAPEHLRAVGNGLTSTYFSALGTGIGAKMLAESEAKQLAAPAE